MYNFQISLSFRFSANGKITAPATVLQDSEQKLNREVSFEVEMVSKSPQEEPKRKSSMRGGSGVTHGPSPNKSVIIDPIPSTNFYSEGSEGASDKTDVDQRNGVLASKQVIHCFKSL